MDFCSGPPMQFLSGVDTRPARTCDFTERLAIYLVGRGEGQLPHENDGTRVLVGGCVVKGKSLHLFLG
jgi:hypothetical protein